MVGNQQKQQRKGRWMNDEDKLLYQLVAKYGGASGEDIDWAILEQHFKGTRDSKQIRERWVNHLNPKIKKRKFNDKEIQIIEDECSKHKFKWAKISKKIPNATPLMIKNFYNNRLKKKNPANRRPSNSTTTTISINYTNSNFNNTTTTINTNTNINTDNLINNINLNNNLNDNFKYYNNEYPDISYYNVSNLSRNNSNNSYNSYSSEKTVYDYNYRTSLSRNSSISSVRTISSMRTVVECPSNHCFHASTPVKGDENLRTLATMADIYSHVESSPTNVSIKSKERKEQGKMSITNLLNKF